MKPAGAIDICGTFGPLASMHAALDRADAGMPCGIVARFENCSAAAIAIAIAQARTLFPPLQMQLVWQGAAPMLQPIAGDEPERAAAWRHELTEDGADVWLDARWPHAMADGISMLRFVEAVGTVAKGNVPRFTSRRTHAAGRRTSFARWLPAFLRDQQRQYLSSTERTKSQSTSWVVLPPATRDRIVAIATDAGGSMAGLLSAAAAIGFTRHQGALDARILLNVPIARRALESTNGFGFGVGSLRFPVHVREGVDAVTLARPVTQRLRDVADRGWDHNLERLLSHDPARHTRFARIEATRRPDPNLTVSWKGMHPGLGGGGQPRDVACFAAAPTLHVSAHADRDGLALSVTGPYPASDVAALLEAIVGELGCAAGETGRKFQLAALAPEPEAELSPVA